MAKPNFDVTTDETGTKSFWFFDDIGPSHLGQISSEQVAEQLALIPNARQLNVHINSIGGSVQEALGIYNSLLRHPAKVSCDIDGVAASAASLIAMACDNIRIAANACMMIHNSAVDSSGTKEQLSKAADTLGMIDKTMADIYSKRTGQPLDQVTDWMRDETWMDAQTCVQRGFANSVSTALKVAACVPAGRYKNTPKQFTAASEPEAKQPSAVNTLALRAEIERRRLKL